MEFFPKGSFLYQHSAALENFVNGVWNRASQSGWSLLSINFSDEMGSIGEPGIPYILKSV